MNNNHNYNYLIYLTIMSQILITQNDRQFRVLAIRTKELDKSENFIKRKIQRKNTNNYLCPLFRSNLETFLFNFSISSSLSNTLFLKSSNNSSYRCELSKLRLCALFNFLFKKSIFLLFCMIDFFNPSISFSFSSICSLYFSSSSSMNSRTCVLKKFSRCFQLLS